MTLHDFKTYIEPLIEDQIQNHLGLKVKACSLLYTALENKCIAPPEFWQKEIRKIMLTEFQFTEDTELLV